MERNKAYIEDKNYFSNNASIKNQPDTYEQIVYINRIETSKPQIKRRR